MTLYPTKYNRVLIAGLFLFAFTLPLSKSAGNVLLFLIYPAAAIGAWYFKDFRLSIVHNGRQPLVIAFSLYYLVALAGILFTEKFIDGFNVSNKILSLPAIYLMASVLIETVRDEEARRRNTEDILLLFIAGLMLLNGIGIMTYLGIVGHKKFVLPLVPLNVHHIWFSNINAVGVYAAVSFLLFSPRGKTSGMRAFLFSFLFLAAICILLSLARSAWFGIALTSAIMTFLIIKNKKIFFLVMAAAVAGCVVVYLFIPFVHARINLITSDIAHFSAGETATSLGERFLMWKAAIMMFLSNPLTGVGTGDYVPTMNSYIAAGKFPQDLAQFNQPHNMYLFALATNGLLGLSALLYIFYRSLKFAMPLMRSDGREKLFAFLALATAVHFMIAGLTDSFFNIQILRYTFAFVMGVCVRNSLKSAHSS